MRTCNNHLLYTTGMNRCSIETAPPRINTLINRTYLSMPTKQRKEGSSQQRLLDLPINVLHIESRIWLSNCRSHGVRLSWWDGRAEGRKKEIDSVVLA